MAINRETSPNCMTEQTKVRLQEKLMLILDTIAQKSRALGESIESAQDWHDNPAYDTLLQELDVLEQRAKRLQAALDNPKVLTPRQETDTVGLGNTVVVQYEDELEPETFTIVGENDSESEVDASWISFKAPLAVALLGTRPGADTKLPNGASVRLIKILPGQFE